MTTYAVFGMTRPRAVEIARKKVPTTEKRGGDYVGLSEAEWEVKVQAEADRIMSGTTVTQLSDKYDAPHFAFDYLNLARSIGRGLHVKSYAKTGDSNPRTGKPIFAWKLVSEADLRN